MYVWTNEGSEQKPNKHIVSPLLRLTAFSNSKCINQHFSHTCSAVKKICYQPLCWITASLTVCLMGTHTYVHIHAIKSLTKVLRSTSLYDCTSCIGGLVIHPVACLNILAWLCIIQAEEKQPSIELQQQKPNNELKSKVRRWIHLRCGLLYVVFSRNRELVEKKLPLDTEASYGGGLPLISPDQGDSARG